MIERNELEKVIEPDEKSKDINCNINYLPHHAVIKLDRLSTRCRLVFDASSKNSEGESLNDQLLAGPALQKDIPNLLIKFRMLPICLIGDISRMFFHINLSEQDRDFYRVLWHDDPESKPEIWRFRTLTMGRKDSPFLAIATVMLHLDKVAKEEPSLANAAEMIRQRLYVDNFLGGAKSVTEAIQL